MKKQLARRVGLSVIVLWGAACADSTRPLQPDVGVTSSTAQLGAPSASYTIHDLGTLPGTTLACCSEGHDINTAGEIAGFSTASDGSFHAVLWHGTTVVDLGIPSGYAQSFAEGINDSEVVVGFVNSGGRKPTAGFIWTASTGMTLLIGPGPVPLTTTASDINSAGAVVGEVAAGGGAFHAYRYTTAGGYVDLHPAGYMSSNALHIAENGDVSGVVTLPGFAATHAALWRASGGFVDLGTLGGSSATALGVNALGTVVGVSTDATGAASPFVWRSTTGMQSGPQPGSANAVSDGGRIVGFEISGSTKLPGTKLGSGPLLALPQFPGRNGGDPIAVNRCGTVTGSATLMVSGVLSTHGARWVPTACDP